MDDKKEFSFVEFKMSQAEINKIARVLLVKYHVLLVNLSKMVIRKYFSLPITWEDLYAETSFELIKFYMKFDPEKHDNFEIYLMTKIVNHMRNYCRKWLSRKHLVLNHASILYDNYLEVNFFDDEESIFLDSVKFTQFEKRIIEYLVYENLSIVQISKNLDTSVFFINKALKSIRIKIRSKHLNIS
ncbi:sigma-70 family RNA polymerase sigma factor [Mycoplasma iguanae]|uniref:Sigma-70 family RNA polymerase sigma factor n=1 Tax=Mycoplasma iguanae TaxID=292461 RepID=A0ABY5RAT6_9MOLU|nr:sigma-70 family RNA polymerase sigma factor [Mycoplasma iguanae]UVD81462.1 sigma-70 family RNA polymerase sigma factor [Mycoplasma iguanae]